MKYTHLTQDERYQIAILVKAGHDKSDIARMMNHQKSTLPKFSRDKLEASIEWPVWRTAQVERPQ